MSLYGDLPQAKKEEGSGNTKGWSSSAAKLQPAVRKPAGVLAPPPTLLRAAAAAGAGAGGSGGRGPGPAGRSLPVPSNAAGRGRGRGPGGVPDLSNEDGGGVGDGAAAPHYHHAAHAPPPSSSPLAAALQGAPETSSSAAAAAGAAPPQQQQQQQQQQPSAAAFFTDATGAPIDDEYDPSEPNGYEDELRRRAQRRREAEEEAERVRRLREAELDAERRRREQDAAAAEIAAMGGGQPGGGGRGRLAEAPGTPAEQQQQQQQQQQHVKAEVANAGIAPMSADERERRLKLSGEEAFAARARMSQRAPAPGLPDSAHAAAAGAPPPSAPDAGAAAPKGMGLAEKLLRKMGWKEGEGLGRNRQGIATPLMAAKRGDRTGVIIAAAAPPVEAGSGGGGGCGAVAAAPSNEQHGAGEVNAAGAPPPEKRARAAATVKFVGRPSRVLALRNMVGPGEVDADLEEEVGAELSKHGAVADVRIFEVVSAGYDPAEAVRIFVRFERADAAVRAAVDLQGRYFGGRQVRVAFFPEDRFEAADLAPAAGEFAED